MRIPIIAIASIFCVMISHAEVAVNEANFPDPVFRAFIIDQVDDNEDGVLSDTEIKWQTTVNVGNSGIKSLKGIELLTGVKELFCAGNELTELLLTNNPNLEEIDCSNNQLTVLDFSSATYLEMLNCDNNELTELNFSTLDGWLWSLHCDNNKIRRLDFSTTPDLEYVYCNNNELVAIDLTGLSYLRMFECTGNKRTVEVDDSKAFPMSVLEADGFVAAKGYNPENLDIDFNTGTMTFTKSEAYYYYETGLPEFGDVLFTLVPDKTDGLEPPFKSIEINETTFPDEAFRTFVKQNVDANSDWMLSEEEIAATDGLRVNDQGIADLTGIGYFSAMYVLHAEGNPLAKVDLSGNENLEWLYLDDTNLVALDLSANTKLSMLSVEDCSRTVVVDAENKFDLTSLVADGFDVSKASDWTGATLDGMVLTFTSPEATYIYDTGLPESEYVLYPTFKLIAGGFSGIEAVAADSLRVYASGKEIHVAGNNGIVSVFNASGIRIYEGTASAIPVGPGFYVVKTGGKAVKVIVR